MIKAAAQIRYRKNLEVNVWYNDIINLLNGQ